MFGYFGLKSGTTRRVSNRAYGASCNSIFCHNVTNIFFVYGMGQQGRTGKTLGLYPEVFVAITDRTIGIKPRANAAIDRLSVDL